MTSLFATEPFQATIASEDGTFAIECTVQETHRGSLQLTEHPVEEGAKITDHAQKEPDELELSVIFSNSPILILASLEAQPSIPGGDPNSRAQDAYDEIRRLQDTATLLTVSTEFRDFENMVITTYSVRRDKETRNILAIDIRLRNYRKATVESVEAPEPVEPVHKVKRKQGRRQTKEPKPEVTEKSESVLESSANALDRIRGAGGVF